MGSRGALRRGSPCVMHVRFFGIALGITARGPERGRRSGRGGAGKPGGRKGEPQ